MDLINRVDRLPTIIGDHHRLTQRKEAGNVAVRQNETKQSH